MQRNEEYANNIIKGIQFVEHVYETRETMTLEGFYFGIVYLLYCIDEEHTFLDWFRYD
jgi:hypothetical protein